MEFGHRERKSRKKTITDIGLMERSIATCNYRIPVLYSLKIVSFAFRNKKNDLKLRSDNYHRLRDQIQIKQLNV